MASSTYIVAGMGEELVTEVGLNTAPGGAPQLRLTISTHSTIDHRRSVTDSAWCELDIAQAQSLRNALDMALVELAGIRPEPELEPEPSE